jgi:hypothetical protein
VSTVAIILVALSPVWGGVLLPVLWAVAERWGKRVRNDVPVLPKARVVAHALRPVPVRRRTRTTRSLHYAVAHMFIVCGLAAYVMGVVMLVEALR